MRAQNRSYTHNHLIYDVSYSLSSAFAMPFLSFLLPDSTRLGLVRLDNRKTETELRALAPTLKTRQRRKLSLHATLRGFHKLSNYRDFYSSTLLESQIKALRCLPRFFSKIRPQIVLFFFFVYIFKYL